ncbi:MAG: hypothetical protein WD738_12800 [Pirellulales bacterium]
MVRLIKTGSSTIRDFSSRREQWRLLLLILPLGLVIILMARLRDPATAERINNFFAASNNRSDEAQKVPPRVENHAARKPAADTRPGLYPGVCPELLTAIADNTYFRNSEKEAWFHFIELLQHTPTEQIESAHSVEADYVQLVDQPDFYRGKLVTVYGYVRQVTEQIPAANDLGIKSYYRVVVQPADGTDWPIFVYCLELPADLSVGDDLMSNVKVTGLFFKKLSYHWEQGLGTAPVIVAKSVADYGSGASMPGQADIHEPSTTDAWAETKADTVRTTKGPAAEPQAESPSFPEILGLAGWDVERLAQFDNGQPFSEAEHVKALELLRRLRSFDSTSLMDWAHDGLSPHDVAKQPADYRGQLIRLKGRVVNVTKRLPAAAEAERLEMPQYFECEVVLGEQAGTSTILTTRVPQAWLQAEHLDEPISAVALYLKRLANGDSQQALWLAKEVAWHPGQTNEPDHELFGPTARELFSKTADKLFGKSVLGNLGMDVGLLDQIQPRGRIRAEEREAFYQMLDAVGRAGPSELISIAEAGLPAVRKVWENEVATEESRSRRALAQEVVRRAEEGRYSVAPLFNEPGNQIGRIIVVDGTARRVVRIQVGSAGGPGDVARSFGIEHYYELEVFTDDSQNYPLVFCVRELPTGFPTRGTIHVPVRVAGFFFKDWLYRTRGLLDEETTTRASGEVDRPQFAPLVIGRMPLVLAAEQERSEAARYVLAGLFVLALAGIWAAAAWYARDDRRFRRRTRAVDFSLPPGQSLNELNLSPAEEPMKDIAQSGVWLGQSE